jgi:hypothetical protein
VLEAIRPPVPEAWLAIYDQVQRDEVELLAYLEDAGLEPVDVWMERRRRTVSASGVKMPQRIIALEATQHVGPVWLVGVVDTTGDGDGEGSVTVRADNAGDAVWRVAQATVRAFALLTRSPIEDAIKSSPDDYLTNLV